MRRIKAKNKNVWRHVGNNPSKGKKIGVPAHVIVNRLIDIVRNLIAM
jgi:hypothetical protein